MLVLPFAEMVLTLLLFLANRGFRLPKALPNQEEGEPDRISVSRTKRNERIFIRLAHQAVAPGRVAHDANAVGALARFFPDAMAMRMPIQLARLAEVGQTPDFSESTVIEFGTPREILFASKTPLDFADVLRVRTADGSLDVEVSVVAVQYHPGKTLVAARFRGDVPNWIVKS